jgi:protein KTI12
VTLPLQSINHLTTKLVLLSGFPCSGLTFRASQLQSSLLAKIQAQSEATDAKSPIKSVVVVSNHGLNLSRSTYATARAEKDARAAFYSEVKRAIGRSDTIVIADGLNYIKGYRYQLFCEAKAVSTPSCVVHVGTRPATCEARNEERRAKAKDGDGLEGGSGENDPYDEETFKNLVFRYEEPNGMARWDSPLYVVIDEDHDVEGPANSIWTLCGGVTDGASKPKVRPNAATVLKPATQADHLYELDSKTSAVVSQILAWQKDHEGEGGGEVSINLGEESKSVVLPSNGVTMPMLQRTRRQFISLNRQHTSLDKRRVGPLFVDYLNDQFSTA